MCHADDHSCYHEWTVYGVRKPKRTEVPEHWAANAEDWWKHVRECPSCGHHYLPPAAMHTDTAYAARVRVIERIIHEPGTVEQVAIGLRELADLDRGECIHHLMADCKRCVTCQARIFLHVLENQ